MGFRQLFVSSIVSIIFGGPRSLFSFRPVQLYSAMYSTVERGKLHTSDYALYISFVIEKEGKGVVSPFHDIPLYADEAAQVYNMVVEIPRWTNAKMEISTKGQMNPIKQDIKKGKVRFVDNVFPYHGYIWNYGALPQTWEDPSAVDEHTSAKGDNDPIDVIELGSKIHPRGAVIQVKVLGTFALIDEGETDWKLVAIDTEDPLAAELNDIEDVDRVLPGYLCATEHWFRVYKMPTGKPANQFAFDGKPMNRAFAQRVISETHHQWQKLIGRFPDGAGSTVQPGEISCKNRGVPESPYYIEQAEADAVADSSPAYDPVPADIPPEG